MLSAPLKATSALLLVTAALVAAGCGSSSKPAYCSDRTSLENSIKGLTESVSSGGLSGLQSQVGTIQSDATKLVSSAKSDFPTQANAVSTSVSSLKQAVNALPANPSASQIATLGTSAAATVTSIKGFTDATQSQCD